ncbi:MAG: Stp1/IreP family PP2C-type Ser/Thr phosphatase [Actinobacteria bacterium]|nr:Stp1/IreP family PP2C-type Ser/Thr phosphatase [Actinomycetota bacterium]
MKVVWGAATHVGMLRQQNEDAFIAQDDLFVVADGMGGHNAGEVASALAIDSMKRAAVGGFSSQESVVAGVNAANAAIHAASGGQSDQRGMGTTLAAVIPLPAHGDEPQRMVVTNVGDSRVYLWRAGELKQVSVDHSYVQELLSEGLVTAEEARVHPRRNIVTRALGIEGDVNADVWVVPMLVGDRYVVCSDGLVDEVDDAELAGIVGGNHSAQTVAQQLVDAANSNGGRDNITVVVVDVADDTIAVESPATTPSDVSTKPRASRKRKVLAAAAVVVVLSLGLGVTSWWARDGYFVGFNGSGDDAELVVFKGQPRQVLWFSPTVRVRTGVARSEVFPALANDIDEQPTYSSLARAQAFVLSIRDVVAAQASDSSD